MDVCQMIAFNVSELRHIINYDFFLERFCAFLNEVSF